MAAERERPRERLEDRGLDALSDAELVALVLRTGAPGDSAITQAHRLLARLGGLEGACRSSAAELAAERGVGIAKAASLAAAFELGRRGTNGRFANREPFRASGQVYEHYRGNLADLRKEVFWVLLLDAKHRKLRDVRISEGSLTASIVHPREVFVPAVRESAAAVILVHNHPSGDPAPSPEDVRITRRLRDAGEMLGVRVLDHVIVGRGRHYSFADSGPW